MKIIIFIITLFVFNFSTFGCPELDEVGFGSTPNFKNNDDMLEVIGVLYDDEGIMNLIQLNANILDNIRQQCSKLRTVELCEKYLKRFSSLPDKFNLNPNLKSRLDQFCSKSKWDLCEQLMSALSIDYSNNF